MTKTRFVSLFVVVAMLLSLGSAVAEGGDIYTLTNNNYPDRHWCYMTDEEVKSYEDAGWEAYTGVLWLKDWEYVGEPEATSVEAVQTELYANGWRLYVIYSWIHDGASLGKHTEQSVSAGYWQLDAVQAGEFLCTYEVPQLVVGTDEVPAKGYYSGWYLDGQSAADPNGEESELVLSLFALVREEYEVYDRGYGEQLVLKNGKRAIYSFDEAVAAGGFDDELWPLN